MAGIRGPDISARCRNVPEKTAKELRAHVVMDELPRTATGKVRNNSLCAAPL